MRSPSFRKGTLALLAAAGFLAAGTTAATAHQAAGAIQTFGNMATGSCLDDSRQYGLRGYGCNGGVHQKWDVRVWNDGTRQLRNLATDKCLYDDGVTLATRACDSSREQSWFVRKTGDQVAFRSQATGECLDDSHYGLRTVPCSYNRHQSWR